MKIRERKGPSQGVAQKCEPRDRNPWAPKFEERTQEETLHQERCARRDAKDLANSVFLLKNKEKATEAWVMLAPSSKKSEEREFVVDSGASMHMLSKKGLKLRRSGTPSKIQEHHDGSNWKTFAIMISSSSSSSTSPPQDSSSKSSSPATERSDDPAPGNWRDAPKKHKNQKRDNNRASEETDCENFWCRACCRLGIVAKYQVKFVFCIVLAGLTKCVFGSNKLTM